MSIILPGDKKYHTLESVDRIGGLPDSILGVILSLLPTKSAVATSTLSKRWEFVWRTVHNLDFCLEGSRVKQVEGEDEKFVGFVNHVLLHNDAGVLNKFHLLWTPNCIESHATSWIKTAITRNVHELSLTLLDYRNGPFDMPLNVFSCDSLRSLHLDGCICLSAATVFCLPRLESLDLNGVTFQSDEALEKIIRGCPMLNDLRISMYVDENDFRIIISSTSLRRLVLNLGFVSDQDLKLEASSLEHLNIYNHGYVSMNFVQKHFSSLVEANFEIYMHYDDDDDFEAGMCDSMVDAVSALDRAKILTLSVDVMRFQMDLDDENDHDHSNWTTPVEVPRCLSTSLKKVVLNGYYGHEDEREMIRYMLKLGSVLEVMQISCDRDVNRKKFELLQEICEFPKKSPACKVKFLW